MRPLLCDVPAGFIWSVKVNTNKRNAASDRREGPNRKTTPQLGGTETGFDLNELSQYLMPTSSLTDRAGEIKAPAHMRLVSRLAAIIGHRIGSLVNIDTRLMWAALNLHAAALANGPSWVENYAGQFFGGKMQANGAESSEFVGQIDSSARYFMG